MSITTGRLKVPYFSYIFTPVSIKLSEKKFNFVIIKYSHLHFLILFKMADYYQINYIL